jgi:AraC-like DNA-binding protein
MALPDAGVSTRVIRPLLAGLVMHGVDPAPLLADVGLDASAVADPAARLPHGAVIRLWVAAEAATVPTLGLRIAEALELTQFDVQMYAVFNAPDLRAGLAAMVRYHRLNHDAAQLSVTESPDGAVFRHTLPGGHRLPRAAAQFVAAIPVLGLRQATGVEVPIRAVRLQHDPPDDLAEYERVFAAPVIFGAEHNEIEFPAEALALPHRGADPALGAILARHGQALLDALPRVHSLVDRVRTLLTEELQGGNPSAEHLAACLKMSPRTLARRLAAEGTAHREVLDELRKDLAQRYFSDPDLSVGEVAFLLGFSEPSAFHRAFKRWTGTTPGRYRSGA